jgi:light-harvesting complex 1 beta chain
MADENGIFTQSGLNEAEAKEVQGYVTQYFTIFLAFAILAHILMWVYKPWFDGREMSMVAPIADSLRIFMA